MGGYVSWYCSYSSQMTKAVPLASTPQFELDLAIKILLGNMVKICIVCKFQFLGRDVAVLVLRTGISTSSYCT
jgi:hypothetical protein